MVTLAASGLWIGRGGVSWHRPQARSWVPKLVPGAEVGEARGVLTLLVTHAQTLLWDLILPAAWRQKDLGASGKSSCVSGRDPGGRSTGGLGFESYLCHILVTCFWV